MTQHKAEFGFGGDAMPANQPQYQNDHAPDSGTWNDRMQHDEPEYEPGTETYNLFYGNGQLHVSPRHDHATLQGHAGVADGHTGPTAAGSVHVERGRATFAVGSNVSLRGLHRVFKDYAKQVGWRWGGLTGLDGEPVDDDFAPKKSVFLRDNETGIDKVLTVQGRTVVGSSPGLDGEERRGILEAGYKLAEVPGGGNFMDTLHRKEDLETHNLYTPDPQQDENPDLDQPTGTFKCPNCRKVFPNWGVYEQHRADESNSREIEPVDDGKFPRLPDMDKTLPPRFVDKQPFVLPLSSWKEAARVEGFDLYATLWGYDNDEHLHYGAFLNGEPVGYATVKEISPQEAEVVMVYSGIPGRHVGRTLGLALQVHYKTLHTHSATSQGARLAKSVGMVEVESQTFKWSAESQPKDMIDSPVPFVYDVENDNIAVGQPGTRHSDIPGEFTPGGIVEGSYEPGGKVVLHTMTNMPYTVRHMLELWYAMHPHMEITGVEMHDANGQRTKLAKTSAQDVGSYIKQLAMIDPAAHQAYTALKAAGGQVYVVGGAVRDALMQKEPKDIDLMVSGLPAEQVNHVLSGLNGRVDLTGKSFGVYRYNVKGHEVEIALPRTETSTGDRRVDFNVNVDHTLPVESDLKRRDFTVNSMAVDLTSGRLVDPYGGAQAVENRLLSTTHPDSFKEDPTRMLRALVMNSRYGFQPDERTRQEMKEHGDRLPLESAEAKKGIIEKWFSSANPAQGVRLAHETGLLKHVFPEVEHAWDFDQNNPHHNLPLGEHLNQVLENMSEKTKDPDLRIAGLLHDIGKPASAWKNPVTGFNHYYRGPQGEGDDHETVGANMAEARLRALNWPVARIKKIKHIIDHHMWPAFSSSKGARKFIQRVGDEHADDLLTFRWADQRGKGVSDEQLNARTHIDQQRGLVEQARSAQAPTSQSALAINGNDIIGMGVAPGPSVGRILRQLTDDVVDEPSLNDRAVLLQRAKEYSDAQPV